MKYSDCFVTHPPVVTMSAACQKNKQRISNPSTSIPQDCFLPNPVRFGMTDTVPVGYELLIPNSKDTELLQKAVEFINQDITGELQKVELENRFRELKTCAELGGLVLLRDSSTNQIIGVASFNNKDAFGGTMNYANLLLYVDTHYPKATLGKNMLSQLIERARQVDGLEELRAFVGIQDEEEMDLLRALGFEAEQPQNDYDSTALLENPELLQRMASLGDRLRADHQLKRNPYENLIMGNPYEDLQPFRLRL